MTTATITTQIAGWDKEDTAAATLAITKENDRRAGLATPLPPLPMSTAAERRTSYQSIMANRLQALHLANVEAAALANAKDPSIKQIRDAALAATPAQRAAALTALTT